MDTDRRRATLLAASCLVAPLVALVSDAGVTVFVSAGYVAPRAGFVDVVRYSTELTRGTFWAGYRFWHLAGLAALGGTVAAGLGRRGAASALLAAGAVAALRFWWALASHTGEGLVVPVGAAWFLAAAALVALAGPPGTGDAGDRAAVGGRAERGRRDRGGGEEQDT